MESKDVVQAIANGELDADLAKIRRQLDLRERSLVSKFTEDQLVVIPTTANLSPRYLLGRPLKFKKLLQKNAVVEVADQAALPAGARFTGTFKVNASILEPYQA